MIRLLGLPDPVKAMLDKGDLTMGHARALLNTPDPVVLARRIVARGLNVRQAEHLAQASDRPRRAAPQQAEDPNIRALEEDLSVRLGLKVAIRTSGEGGSVTFRYSSLEQLDELLRRLR
jgi:ParB family chromosome partitioning protein